MADFKLPTEFNIGWQNSQIFHTAHSSTALCYVHSVLNTTCCVFICSDLGVIIELSRPQLSLVLLLS